MKIKYAIPSYNRVEKQLTLEMLKQFGVSKEDIVLSTQNEKDYKEYSEKYGNDCTVIYKEGHSVTDNRNTLLEYFDKGQWIIMLDDDIKNFNKLDKNKLKRIDSYEELEKMFTDFFEYAQKYNSQMWGVYPVDNAMFMKPSIDKKNIVNTCLGIINNEKFDSTFKAKEDIELCCRLISKGKNVIRFNFISFNAQHRTKGGCYDCWKDGTTNEGVSERLVRKYPALLKKNTKRSGEVLYHGKRN